MTEKTQEQNENPSFYRTIVDSYQWKEWVNYNEQIPKFDVHESMECGWLSEKHFQAFMSFSAQFVAPSENPSTPHNRTED
jgi:hypothetical protein